MLYSFSKVATFFESYLFDFQYAFVLYDADHSAWCCRMFHQDVKHEVAEIMKDPAGAATGVVSTLSKETF